MEKASFRFFGRLARFLSDGRDKGLTEYQLNGTVAVKHAIEAQGIPHTEIELIQVNGSPVGFYYQLRGGDAISVYPDIDSRGIVNHEELRPPLSYPPGFIIDNHLGQLARNLRLLGFDCLYDSGFDDDHLARVSYEEDRVLLTRDRRLLMRKIVRYGFCLLSRNPDEQLQEVLQRFKLRDYVRPWHRCLRCNGALAPVEKEAVIDRLEPKTRKYYHHFHICQDCDQIYWKGSHFPALERLVATAG